MMRTRTKLIAGAAVLLAMAGCTGGPKPAPSEPKGSTSSTDVGSSDAVAAGDVESLAVQSTNKHLLADEGGYRFYSLVPVNPEDGRLCVVIQSEGGAGSKGCGNSTPYAGLGFGETDDLLEAKLVFSGYNPSKELAEGWRYLHPNLLVRGLDDPQSGLDALDAPAEPADTLTGDAKNLFGVRADSARLLVKENDHAFYAAIPNHPDKGDICVVVENLKADTASASCSGVPSVELGAAGVKAKLVVDDYDASKELAEGWRQLHKNLLVNP